MSKTFPAYRRISVALLLLTTTPSVSCCNHWMGYLVFLFLLDNLMMNRFIFLLYFCWEQDYLFLNASENNKCISWCFSSSTFFFRSSNIYLHRKTSGQCYTRDFTCRSGFKSMVSLHPPNLYEMDEIVLLERLNGSKPQLVTLLYTMMIFLDVLQWIHQQPFLGIGYFIQCHRNKLSSLYLYSPCNCSYIWEIYAIFIISLWA